MRTAEEPTRTIDVDAGEARLSDLIADVQRGVGRVVVEQNGVPVAAIVTAKDLDRLRQLDRDRAERWAVLEAMRAPFRDVPPEEIEREAAKAVAEVRAEMRAEREAARS